MSVLILSVEGGFALCEHLRTAALENPETLLGVV